MIKKISSQETTIKPILHISHTHILQTSNTYFFVIYLSYMQLWGRAAGQSERILFMHCQLKVSLHKYSNTNIHSFTELVCVEALCSQ